MGWPLTAAAVVATFLLVRWAQKNDVDEKDTIDNTSVVDEHREGRDTPTGPDQPDEITGQAPPAR
jgi:hypothetical protein